VALVGLALMARPASTPTQDCGSSLLFLLDGRSNEFVDPGDPPAGITAEEAQDNNERPCRVRVADVARPGAVALAAGLISAFVAALVEIVARAGAWRRRVKQQRGGPPAGEAGAPPPAPPPPPPPSAGAR
jgi:hypothetical protein